MVTADGLRMHTRNPRIDLRNQKKVKGTWETRPGCSFVSLHADLILSRLLLHCTGITNRRVDKTHRNFLISHPEEVAIAWSASGPANFNRVNQHPRTCECRKIRDTSPDQKFAVRISCNSEPEDPNNIDPSLIAAVQLVSLL
jgi:hypothetical protein